MSQDVIIFYVNKHSVQSVAAAAFSDRFRDELNQHMNVIPLTEEESNATAEMLGKIADMLEDRKERLRRMD